MCFHNNAYKKHHYKNEIKRLEIKCGVIRIEVRELQKNDVGLLIQRKVNSLLGKIYGIGFRIRELQDHLEQIEMGLFE
jgi:hypothetical protein